MLCEFLWLVSLEIQCLVQFPYYNNYFVRMISFLAWFFICFCVRLLLEFAGVADIGWTVFIGKLFFSCYNLCWNDGYICYSVLCVLLLFMDHILIYVFYYFRLVIVICLVVILVADYSSFLGFLALALVIIGKLYFISKLGKCYVNCYMWLWH